MLTQCKQNGMEYIFNFPEITTPNNAKCNCRPFQRPVEVWRWHCVLQGKDVSGSFFKAVTKEITDTRFIASLWAMNDLSPSLSGIDSRLRQTTNDCWSKCSRLQPLRLGLQPSSSTLPTLSLQRPHPPQSSSAGLICTHLELLPLGLYSPPPVFHS